MANHSKWHHCSILCLMGKSFHKEHQRHIDSIFDIQFHVHKIQMDWSKALLLDLVLVLKVETDINISLCFLFIIMYQEKAWEMALAQVQELVLELELVQDPEMVQELEKV